MVAAAANSFSACSAAAARAAARRFRFMRTLTMSFMMQREKVRAIRTSARRWRRSCHVTRFARNQRCRMIEAFTRRVASISCKYLAFAASMMPRPTPADELWPKCSRFDGTFWCGLVRPPEPDGVSGRDIVLVTDSLRTATLPRRLTAGCDWARGGGSTGPLVWDGGFGAVATGRRRGMLSVDEFSDAAAASAMAPKSFGATFVSCADTLDARRGEFAVDEEPNRGFPMRTASAAAAAADCSFTIRSCCARIS
mmetsp:Transcript_41269/g.127466  ORF Transcript_41269/g.127466 Transcript_41269/m.127466 type:complete len:253 (+) Transcript_41269:559-1317(+)